MTVTSIRGWRRIWAERLVYGCSALLTALYRRLARRPQSPKTVLFIKRDGLGDLVYALPSIKAFAEQYPASEVYLWCKPEWRALAEAEDVFNEVYISRPPLRRWGLLVEMRGNLASLAYSLITLPKYRVDRASVRLQKRRTGQLHEIETNRRILSAWLSEVGATVPAKPWLDSGKHKPIKAFSIDGSYAVIHPGGGALRRWPAERFAKLCGWLATEGLTLVLIGSGSEERTICGTIAALSAPGSVLDLSGQLALEDLPAVVASGAIFIGNESGPLHLAAAAGCKRIVGLFGPGEPTVFYPPGAGVRILHEIRPCNPCDQVSCIHREGPCMQAVGYEQVKLTCQALLAQD